MKIIDKNKIINFLIIVAFVLAAAFLVRFGLNNPKDGWVCQNGQWVKRGSPTNGMPDELCGQALQMPVQLFFNNSNFGSGFECQKVAGVRTKISETNTPEIQTLRLMLQGPTPEQKERGYFSSIRPGTKALGLVIEDGLAIVDFNQNPWEAGDACRPLGARAQIEKTLKQFSSIQKVQFLANGKKIL